MSYRIRKQGFRQENKEENPSCQTEKSSILPIATPAAAGSGGNEALSVQLPSSSLSFPIAFLSLSLFQYPNHLTSYFQWYIWDAAHPDHAPDAPMTRIFKMREGETKIEFRLTRFPRPICDAASGTLCSFPFHPGSATGSGNDDSACRWAVEKLVCVFHFFLFDAQNAPLSHGPV
jgi:hypothetical protein